MVGLKVLVQGRDGLDVDEINEFIQGISDARLVVFHCSINDDSVLERFVKELQKKLVLPFLGVRVSATLTNDGFHEESVVVGVFSGDFNVRINHVLLDFENPGGTIERLVSDLPDEGLCIAYATGYLTEGVKLDYILRQVNLEKPNLQFSGALSSPQHFVFSNDGFFRDRIVYCYITGVEFNFELKSGLEFQADTEEYTITHASDHAIQEINNQNAVSLYCGLKHVRPYFVNTLVATVTRPDIHKVLKMLSQTNEKLYEIILQTTMELMGSHTAEDLIEVSFILHLDEETSEWTTQAFRPEGANLKWLKHDVNKQLSLYDELYQEHPNYKFIFGHECAYRLFWMNFRIKDIEEKASKFKIPLMLSYGYGEIGAYLPYTDVNVNLMHGGIMQVLGFK